MPLDRIHANSWGRKSLFKLFLISPCNSTSHPEQAKSYKSTNSSTKAARNKLSMCPLTCTLWPKAFTWSTLLGESVMYWFRDLNRPLSAIKKVLFLLVKANQEHTFLIMTLSLFQAFCYPINNRRVFHLIKGCALHAKSTVCFERSSQILVMM